MRIQASGRNLAFGGPDCTLPWHLVGAVWAAAAIAGLLLAVLVDRLIPRR